MATVKVNGINLYYREAGSGEPLVLIHATGFNADVWDKVIAGFAQDYRVIVYDRRAYQRSQGQPPVGAYYGKQHGDDMAGLLKALGATPANLVGWSAGAIFSLYATLQHPACVRQLILYEAPLYITRSIDFAGFREFSRVLLLKAIGKKAAAAEGFIRMVLAYQNGSNSYDRLSSEFRAKLATDKDTLLTELMAVMRERLRPKTLSSQIKVPVTLLVGEQSLESLKRTTEYLANILHNAPVAYLPEANHFAQVDHPDVFVKAVKEALKIGYPI